MGRGVAPVLVVVVATTFVVVLVVFAVFVLEVVVVLIVTLVIPVVLIVALEMAIDVFPTDAAEGAAVVGMELLPVLIPVPAVLILPVLGPVMGIVSEEAELPVASVCGPNVSGWMIFIKGISI